jgi:hypothetical protein
MSQEWKESTQFMRGILVGCALSIPLWIGIFFLTTWILK